MKLTYKEFLIENLGQHVIDHAVKTSGKHEDIFFNQSEEDIRKAVSKAFVELSGKPVKTV